MKKEIADRWIAALRSGTYRQGRTVLRDRGGSMCCLGVLCDLSGLSEWEHGETYLNESLALPIEVMEWAGIETPSGEYKDTANSLIADNDTHKLAFPQIADIIEKHWEKL